VKESSDRSSQPRDGRRTSGRGLPLFLLVAVVVATFSNSFGNGFHLDDFYRIRDNPEIRHVSPVLRHFRDPGTISGSRGVSETPLNQLGQYRPLLPLTLSLNYAVAGHSLTGYHVVNLAIHLLACVLVFLLVFTILGRTEPAGIPEGRRRWTAFVIALIYGVHPLSGYPVNYILARDLLLMQAFLVGSLLVYANGGRRPSTMRWVVALVLLELALMSKVTAAVAPLLVLAWEWTIGGRDLRSRTPWLRAAPFAGVVAAHLAVVRWALDLGSLSRVQSGGWSWAYAWTQADIHVSEYLKNFVWPIAIRMAPFVDERTSPLEPRVLLGLAVVGLSLVLAIRLRRRAPAIAFALLGYWALMLPESSVLPISHAAVHYRALPSSWLLYMALALTVVPWARPRLAFSLGIAVAVALAGLSFSMNRIYRTEESLWAHSLRYGGEALAHMNYAMSLPDRDDPRVLLHLEKAVEMSPNYVLAHVNLGLLALDLGRTESGLTRLREVARMAPDWPDARYWLSVGYQRVGDFDAAVKEAAVAADLDPSNVRTHYNLALAESGAGRFANALVAARRALELAPDDADAEFANAYALQMTGHTEEAARAYSRVLESRPEDLDARFNRAYAWVSLGRCQEALPELVALLRARPEHSGASRYEAVCRREAEGGPSARESAIRLQYDAAFAAYRAGDYRRSLEFVRLVQAIDPEFEQTGFLAGFDLQMLGRLEEAVEAYETYLDAKPDDSQVRFNLGHALMTLGHCDRAIEQFERALELQPDYAEAGRWMETCRETEAHTRSARRDPGGGHDG
jgi:tetratricopeptide (TPR) repeat protein